MNGKETEFSNFVWIPVIRTKISIKMISLSINTISQILVRHDHDCHGFKWTDFHSLQFLIFTLKTKICMYRSMTLIILVYTSPIIYLPLALSI